MDDIAVNNISYHQLTRWIQNAWKPTNFAVAVQESGKKIWVFFPVYLLCFINIFLNKKVDRSNYLCSSNWDLASDKIRIILQRVFIDVSLFQWVCSSAIGVFPERTFWTNRIKGFSAIGSRRFTKIITELINTICHHSYFTPEQIPIQVDPI